MPALPSAVKKRASELLMDEHVRPGVDYALSEVVHCPSAKELGVNSALAECAGRYLLPILQRSGAKIVVCLGRFARTAICEMFSIPEEVAIYGPQQVGDQLRYFSFLPHPNAWKGPWSFEGCLSREELSSLQEFLGVR